MSLDERKCKILGAVVRDYVSTVRPVGSEDLAARHAWGVKSATIRNELAELSELGYLRQPHTSAGRIPSDQGYRFYVDHLMLVREVETPAAASSPSFTPELDALLRQTCALLSRMTSYTSVATRPRPADTQVVQVFLSGVSGERLLLVLVLSTGQVQNCLVPDAPDLAAPDLVSLGNALNAAFSGKTLDAITAVQEPATMMAADLPSPLRPIFAMLLQAVRQSLSLAVDEDNVYLEGASEILRQPEFRDADKLDGVLDALQRRTLLFQTMSRTLLGPEATVVIGSENHVETMRECSVVTAPYFLGTRERGTIGVVGPTRMDYDRAVPAVGFFARTLTQTLARLGIR